MKKYFLFFSLLALLSCNQEDNSTANSSFQETAFLISKIITHYDNTEVSGNEALSYKYNQSNKPTQLNRESSTGEISLILEFTYNEAGDLMEIITPSPENNGTYEKAMIQTLNTNGAKIKVSRYNSDDVLLTSLYEIMLEFDGYLIKSYSLKPDDASASNGVYSNFTHDNDGKLLSFSQGTINFDPDEFEVTTWDDNSLPDTINFFTEALQEVRYWFPKHYISTKNPTSIFKNTSETINTFVTYEYNAANGSVSGYMVTTDDPDVSSSGPRYSKEYIEAN